MIKVALVGIGNCASALVQGISYYTAYPNASGLITADVCGYRASDLVIVAAFDVDPQKVGRPLHEAIYLGKNNTIRFHEAKPSVCIVSPAPLLDGVSKGYAEQMNTPLSGDIEEAKELLKRVRPDVLVNYLPVGSDAATQFWAETCLELKIAFVNAIPSFIVSAPDWATRFRDKGVACAGDDVKSQVGATLLHRALAHAFSSRGAEIGTTYQLNFGGNMDFYNMLEDERIESKKISKHNAVRAELPPNMQMENVHISPTGYIGFLADKKLAYINVIGTGFGGTPIEVELKLSVWDSPNSAGVILDVVRFVADSARRGIGGPIDVCDFYFKSPPVQRSDTVAGLAANANANANLE